MLTHSRCLVGSNLVLVLSLTALVAACGGLGSNDVMGAPDQDAGPSGPGTAPTGQTWEEVVDDKGCGRSGVTYVLVDEVCGGDGLGYANPQLQAPMFRDGAVFGDTLLAVDATHLWGLDLRRRSDIQRTVLLSGLGQPVAAAAHGDELLLAAGERGLVRIDASDPRAPQLTSHLDLEGFAHDVTVEGDIATLALGRGGISRVHLTQNNMQTTISLPGYAAGVITRGKYAYVAGCDAMRVVDVESQQVVGSAWTPYAMDGAILSAAAKDIALVGDVAFVAAGRHGAVAIDVRDPSAPAVLGNCTLDDPAFYASGVRAQGNTLFVAGGEYGVLKLDVSDPRTTCPALVPPAVSTLAPPDASNETEGECTTAPPWEVMPWERIWAPPPPAKDPIQVLPDGDVVYAFGDARRIGTRAVDIRSFASADLPLVGRYDEPRRALGVAASGNRVVVIGAHGGMFQWQDDALVRTPSDFDAEFRAASAAVFTGGGRWVLLRDNKLILEGASAPRPLDGDFDVMTSMGMNSVVVSGRHLVKVIDLASGLERHLPALPGSVLPLSIAASDSEVYLAAPEWPQTVQLLPSLSYVSEHKVFTEQDAFDVNLWRKRLPRRQLVATPFGLAEVAVLGERAGVVLHRAGDDNPSVSVPAANYVAGAADASHVYFASIDRSSYRSSIATFHASNDALALQSIEVFSGAVAGIAATREHVYIADADGVLRVYDSGTNAPILRTLVTLELP